MVVFISILSFLSAGLQKFPLLCGFRQLQLIRLSDLLLFQIPQGKIRFPQGQIGIIVRIPVFQDLRPSPGKDSHLPVESGPVSYTHLDVYKRQKLSARAFPNFSMEVEPDMEMEPDNSAPAASVVFSVSVSYTHLIHHRIQRINTQKSIDHRRDPG